MTRIGYIDFLNSLPVYHAFETGAVALPDDAELVKGVPTDLNARLLSGDLDIAPVSSIEYARHADVLELLPGLSINSAGFVHSVTLFYRNDIESLRGGRICVTDTSATSVVLLRTLLDRHFGLDATLVPGTPDLEALGHDYDGALLIGDDALRAVLAYPNLGRRDLGQEWRAFAGHPMVFALWCARRDFVAQHPDAAAAAHQALVASKAWGDAHRAEVVEVARKRAWLSRAYMRRYFQHLDYGLDADKLAGLQVFFEHALDLGEIAAMPELPGSASAVEVRA